MPHLALPIVLAHGIFMRDDSRANWGRVPLWLSEGGNAVFFAGTDACSPAEDSARVLARRIERVLGQTNAPAVHVIGFSRGGIDACLAAHELGSGRIASITTLCTPHRGSFVAENGFSILPNPAVRVISSAASRCAQALGDESPQAYRVFRDLDAATSQRIAHLPGVSTETYCQSFALSSRRPCRMSFMMPVSADEIPNDGLVSVRSATWENYRGAFFPAKSSVLRDIRHKDMVDGRKRQLELGIRRPNGEVSYVGDLRDAWCLIVNDLKGHCDENERER